MSLFDVLSTVSDNDRNDDDDCSVDEFFEGIMFINHLSIYIYLVVDSNKKLFSSDSDDNIEG